MTDSHFEFHLKAKQEKARAGSFHTPHGAIETPVFMPVGTQATVKALTPAQLEEIRVQVLLANTYHLFIRPGAELIAQLGGLHAFMNWQKPILTDSGGFQVFSLSDLRKVSDEGVMFKSHLNGSKFFFTPELSVEVQEMLGADIIMAFDECPEPTNRKLNERAVKRTNQWAQRCLQAKTRYDQALFGIVQGGVFEDLRQASAQFITSLKLPGYAIGGLSVGESKQQTYKILDLVDDLIPDEKPRYLMGVGMPEDIIEGIRRGIDMFDCVLPTRLARHQTALTMNGRLNLRNAIHARDAGPIDVECPCYTCRHFSRGYLRHLIMAKEILASTLLSIHNIFTLVELTTKLRKAILQKRFNESADEFIHQLSTLSKS